MLFFLMISIKLKIKSLFYGDRGNVRFDIYFIYAYFVYVVFILVFLWVYYLLVMFFFFWDFLIDEFCCVLFEWFVSVVGDRVYIWVRVFVEVGVDGFKSYSYGIVFYYFFCNICDVFFWVCVWFGCGVNKG